MNIVIDSEEKFKIKLLSDIGDKYLCFKSQHNFSPIDFICINKMNLKTFYIEHKKRKGARCNYETLYIGFNKVNEIDEHYKHSYYVWEFDEVFYWIKHSPEFLKLNNSYVNGSRVYHIEKSECFIGYETLLNEINSFSNERV